ncbi:BamA/TamA family outer membrane protein [Candidatus Poribacteria bacterium]|mgnify:CR=1 FL=1|jgi:outer membrane protein assembly factor BamA|nr:BamA/TamA family outer membrane protein [Candidatus Poribacteria bacterium]MBT5531878.1 BamA/TamA family outer membrane protein [Candidatus Poribacteria bacterium]MBT5712597.1 BamA/TamA family outer membrane protein [Candidatus Poribacteria bacterium]MBT7095816.1 BamA/TamA family outer membrane protein [Candidatus Poribacteria bacterium]MBT7808607.1 BamA/TamA family outer membrane protein [Candidatus Poribacteria bacterium]
MGRRARVGILVAIAALTACPLPLRATTRYIDRDAPERGPVDAVRIVGNRGIGENEILNALGQGPDDIKNAVRVMQGVLPYFRSVEWSVEKEGDRRVLLIDVVEHTELEGLTELSAAFNRVSGWAWGLRRDWWRRADIRSDPKGRFFAEARYAFGNDRWQHRYGAEARWFVRRRHEIVATALRQRWLAPRDIDVMPNNAEQTFLAMTYGADYRDYHERLGSELSVRAQTEDTRHTVTTRVVAERHVSMTTASGWSLFAPRGGSEANMPATPGRLRAITAEYEFDGRNGPVFTEGWAQSVAVERSLPGLGSDFAFTRVQSHTRAYFRFGDDFVNARLRVVLAGGDPPLQRQVVWGGSGSLRGYERHAFVGPNGWLTNVEYRRHFFSGTFGLVFADAARVWGAGLGSDTTAVHASVGYGILLENALRVRVARALRSGARARWHVRWARTF